MENDDITKTRNALTKDTTALKRDIGKIATDVKDHATAHVDLVKGKAGDTFQMVNDYARENPLHLVLAAFAFGLFIGFTRRK
jgi:ElaB/YqjD/DUF883 family membrane-anchored ribosome-binding protein